MLYGYWVQVMCYPKNTGISAQSSGVSAQSSGVSAQSSGISAQSSVTDRLCRKSFPGVTLTQPVCTLQDEVLTEVKQIFFYFYH